MSAVSNLRPVESLSDFLHFLFRTETGYVYAPTKSLDLNNKSDSKGRWTKNFFRWPMQREELIEHIEKNRKLEDVYLAPALFTKPFNKDSESIECVKGSFTFWVDFDGNAPNEELLRETHAPFPSWRNCSSTAGHEHWYWSSPTFIENIADLQDTNKALTYALNGDKGGWYAHKVLRPVSGINHKRNAEEVTVLSRREKHTHLREFEKIPVPGTFYTASDYNPHNTPHFIEILMKYTITDPEFVALIKKPEIREGSRSDALAKVAHFCAEHGMSGNEIHSIVDFKDKHWKKFTDRSEDRRIKAISDLVNYALNKHESKPKENKKEQQSKTLGWMDILSFVDDTKYIIKDLLPVDNGILVLAGRSGSQKTTLALDLFRELVCGRHRFDWKSELEEPLRVMMLSMEMPFGQLKEFINPGTPEDPHDRLILNENFKFRTERFKLYDDSDANKKKIQECANAIGDFKPHVVIIDSATVALAPGDQNNTDVQKSLDLLAAMMEKLGFSVVIIAHTRKDPPRAGYRDKDLDDLFGAQNLAAAATAVIGIQKERNQDDQETGNIDVKYLKTRFTGTSEKFQIRFNPENFTFYRPAMAMAGAPITSTAPVETPKPKPKRDDDGGGFIPV